MTLDKSVKERLDELEMRMKGLEYAFVALHIELIELIESDSVRDRTIRSMKRKKSDTK